MKPALSLSVLILIGMIALFGTDVSARRDILEPEQKAQLAKVDRILVEVVAITDQGPVEPGPLQEVVVKRLKEAGYQVVTDPAQPSDVVFKVKCEQRKVWEGTTTMGSDADLPDSPSRVWKGPACQLLYLLGGKKLGWQKEVRTEFLDSLQAAAVAKAADPGQYALAKLTERLAQYDFPVLVTADWGQEDRLLKMLNDPAATSGRKVQIVVALGDLFSAKAVPQLLKELKGSDLEVAKAAAVALGNIGNKDSIPALVGAMQSGKPELPAAAAKGLGVLGSLHSDFSVITPLLEALKNDDLGVKTEVVLALGKLPDKRSYEPLFALSKSLQKMHSTDPDPKQKKLKDAVNYSLKQIDTWEYIQ
ncbi:MAG: HEAT repeat domain-containing protein [Nitrospirae bacterium]|nr:MAG: HEAT repeat domain-containing protein [Nitrospirota bacterium]